MDKTMLPMNLLPEYNQAYIDDHIEDLKKHKFYTGCIWETARAIEEYYDDYKNQLIIKEAYTGIGRPDLINSFDKPGNRKFKYTGPKAIENTYNPDTITFYANYIKWLMPIFLLLSGLFLRYRIKSQ